MIDDDIFGFTQRGGGGEEHTGERTYSERRELEESRKGERGWEGSRFWRVSQGCRREHREASLREFATIPRTVTHLDFFVLARYLLSTLSRQVFRQRGGGI